MPTHRSQGAAGTETARKKKGLPPPPPHAIMGLAWEASGSGPGTERPGEKDGTEVTA